MQSTRRTNVESQSNPARNVNTMWVIASKSLANVHFPGHQPRLHRSLFAVFYTKEQEQSPAKSRPRPSGHFTSNAILDYSVGTERYTIRFMAQHLRTVFHIGQDAPNYFRSSRTCQSTSTRDWRPSFTRFPSPRSLSPDL